MGEVRAGALRFAADFFAAHGFGERWIFWDARARSLRRARPETRRAACSTRRALLVGLATVNRLPRTIGKRRVFVDLDPGVTQIEAQHDPGLRALLDEYDVHFTIGENIGRAGCAVPTGPWTWHADASAGRPGALGAARRGRRRAADDDRPLG